MGRMGGAYYILMINVALGVAVLAAFLCIWMHDRSRTAPLAWAGGTLLFMVNGGLELAAPFVAEGHAAPFRFVLHSVNYAACTLLASGVSLYYGLRASPRHLLLAFAGGLLLFALIIDMPRQSVLRMSLNQAPLVAMVALAALRVVWHRERWRLIDRAVMAAHFAFALNMALRPVLLALHGTMGADPAVFHTTQYALVSQFSMAVVTLCAAMTLLILCTTDIVVEMRERSDRDPLTGLANRRRFEEAVADAFAKADRSGRPVSLVVADIDRFKRVNDAWGHAAGDAVIATFAAVLSSHGRDGDVVARMGGEEFVTGLWNTDAAGARLYAEARRTAFAALPVPGLLETERFTASFGVAERVPGEDVSSVLKRADAALYEAKRSGRDRVVVATRGAAARAA